MYSEALVSSVLVEQAVLFWPAAILKLRLRWEQACNHVDRSKSKDP